MKLKRVVVSLLVFVSIFVFCACNETQPKNRTTNMSADDTIELTIFAYDGGKESSFGLINFGHSFLGFKNLGTEPVIVGDYELNPNEEMTISTWCMSAHFGVWYNVEGAYIKLYGKYKGRLSITTHINIDKLDKINSYIDNNDSWRPTKNCTNFCTGLWNIAVSKDEKLKTYTVFTPKKLLDSIICFSDYKQNKYVPENTNIGYFKNGVFKKFAMEA